MLRHVVMITLREDAEPALDERLRALEAGLRGMPAAIPEIRALELGRDVVHGARSAQLVLIVDLDDLEALERYRVHPAHRDVVERLIQPTVEKISAVDFLKN
jgi:hypothetical protein